MIVFWMVVGTLIVFVFGLFGYALYEALIWPTMDMTMHPKLRRPWTIRRVLNRRAG